MKNAAAPGPKSKAKSFRRPRPGGWRRLPRRQRERIIRIFMFVFVALFVLSVAGGLILTSITRVPAK